MFQRFLIIAIILILAACSSRPQIPLLDFPSRLCPGFSKPTWQLLKDDIKNPQQLLAQQKFALLPEQSHIWFGAPSGRYLGLCIPPASDIFKLSNDCGTIYVIYKKREDTWQLTQQKVTICPG